MKIHSTVKREDVCSLGNSVDKEIYGRLVGLGISANYTAI